MSTIDTEQLFITIGTIVFAALALAMLYGLLLSPHKSKILMFLYGTLCFLWAAASLEASDPFLLRQQGLYTHMISLILIVGILYFLEGFGQVGVDHDPDDRNDLEPPEEGIAEAGLRILLRAA